MFFSLQVSSVESSRTDLSPSSIIQTSVSSQTEQFPKTQRSKSSKFEELLPIPARFSQGVDNGQADAGRDDSRTCLKRQKSQILGANGGRGGLFAFLCYADQKHLIRHLYPVGV